LTDGERAPQFPPMHSVTRLGRVIQQLRSFAELHAGELEALAAELDTPSPSDVAARLRIYRDVQRDEAQMIVDELVDIQTDMAAAQQAATGQTEAAVVPTAAGSRDPAVNSPRRAKWLAEQAAEEERRRQPLSRRNFFGGGAKPEA
jgi:hypothetical protein